MHPKIRSYRIRWISCLACLLLTFSQAVAQPTPAPETQELLNGLKILFWPKPGSSEVLLKLRIHSGSAFDLAGKSGQMALLGDIMFPDPATVDYFTEQMGGKLNVNVTYDSVTITLLGKADQLENIIEVLRNAILATQLTPELVSKMRENRIKLVRDSSVSPTMVADRAIAVRLFGDFPYGRPSAGFPEDLARIERGDLMLVRDRFVNSNNATLAIVGGINKPRAVRTLRQLLGPWRKSEQVVPSSFQAPKMPDTRALIVNLPSPTSEIRIAWRGVGRPERDYYTAKILAKIAEYRWQASNPELASKPAFARSESYMLPGIFVMGTVVGNGAAVSTLNGAKKVAESLISTPITPAELGRAKNEILTLENAAAQKIDSEPDPWLDMDTYRLSEPPDRATAIAAISPGDVQRLAARIFKDTPVATVVVGDAPQLKAAFQGQLQYEVLGEVAQPVPAKTTPSKPGTPSSPR